MPKHASVFSLTAGLLVTLGLASCAHDSERASVLRAGLSDFGGGYTKIVLTRSLTPEDREAAMQVLPTMEASAFEKIPFKEDQQVPGNLFFLYSIKIDGDHAVVTGASGLIPKSSEGNLFACGTSYTLNLERVGKQWTPGVSYSLNC